MQQSKAKAVSILLTAIITVAAAQVLAMVYFVLGVFTGVWGGMCAFAPDWWENIYYKILYLIPVLSIVVGMLFGRQIYEKQKFNIHIN